MDVHSDTQHTAGVRRGSAERAAGDWLLTATQSRDRSRREWQHSGVTMLPTGTVFSAVRMSARLIHAAANTADLRAVDAYLARALIGGPVIHDPDRCRYYALVPVDGPGWQATRDLELCGPGYYIGVPRPGLNSAADTRGAPYWSVPMEEAGALCVPSAVAALAEIGYHELGAHTPVEGVGATPLLVKGRR